MLLTKRLLLEFVMVLLRVKISEEDQFIFRTTTEEIIGKVQEQLVEIFNLRQKIRRLKIETEELGKHGMTKEPDAQAVDDSDSVEKGEFYVVDPSGKRNGNACCPESRNTLTQTITDAMDLLHKNRAEKRNEVTKVGLLEAVDLIRGAVMICYPMGLPEWDPVRCLLENRDHDTETHGYEMHGAEEMTLWFAGKELQRGNLLKTHIGDKETTTATVRLTKADQGAPSREPVIDEATYKGMLSWSYKKQEEQKALAENEDDCYLDSEWANTKSLKLHLNGTRNIRI